MKSVQIPFPGFYCSLLESFIDSVEEQEIEHMLERQEDASDPDSWQPDVLRLDAMEFGHILYRHMQYGVVRNYLAKRWVEHLNQYAEEVLRLDLQMQFEEMVSPREYNFTTDRVFVLMPEASIELLMREAMKDRFIKLEREIKARFTSRDGFISSYSNCLDTWFDKPLMEWDHNELGTLLASVLGDEGEIESHILDEMNYSSPTDFERAFEEGLVWPDFQAAVQNKRDEIREAILEEFPDWKFATWPNPNQGVLL